MNLSCSSQCLLKKPKLKMLCRNVVPRPTINIRSSLEHQSRFNAQLIKINKRLTTCEEVSGYRGSCF